MKKAILNLALAAGTIIHFANLDGALPENTLAPGEQHCGRSVCHNVQVNSGNASMSILFQNGATEYQPDSIYEITVKVENTLTSRNGFEILALRSGNQNAGTWQLTEPSKMKVIPGIGIPARKYVTHLAAGNQQSTWAMQWKAPSGNPGTVTFYASVLCANDNGLNSGDQVYNTKITIPQLTTGTREPISTLPEVFPNPAKTGFLVKLPDGQSGQVLQIISAATGVVRAVKTDHSGQVYVGVGDFSPGVYFVGVAGGASRKVVIIP